MEQKRIAHAIESNNDAEEEDYEDGDEDDDEELLGIFVILNNVNLFYSIFPNLIVIIFHHL